MNWQGYRIRPNDLMMFRDGKPFNQADEGASSAQSLFPPPPPTVIGAIRMALASQLGFNPALGGRWPIAELGDGVNWQSPHTSLGVLQFGAMCLERTLGPENKDRQLLFPAPAHLAGVEEGGQLAPKCLLSLPLHDTGVPFSSDLGDAVPFAAAPPGMRGIKLLGDAFVSLPGMKAILKGQVPDPREVVSAGMVFQTETKVGIGRNAASRTTNEGELYTASFVRLADNFSIIQPLHGVPSAGTRSFSQRLGGEHRVAHFDFVEAIAELNELAGKDHDISSSYVAVCLSPALLSREPKHGDNIDGLPGHLETLCMPKPISLGGWDSVSKPRRSIPMRQLVPAGSVFFMKTDSDFSGSPAPLIGGANQWGFGQIAIGKWPEWKGNHDG